MTEVICLKKIIYDFIIGLRRVQWLLDCCGRLRLHLFFELQEFWGIFKLEFIRQLRSAFYPYRVSFWLIPCIYRFLLAFKTGIWMHFHPPLKCATLKTFHLFANRYFSTIKLYLCNTFSRTIWTALWKIGLKYNSSVVLKINPLHQQYSVFHYLFCTKKLSRRTFSETVETREM